MQLRDWLLDNGVSIAAFAHRIGLCRTHVSSILTGNRRTSPRTAKKIEEVTNGDVTAKNVLSGNALGYEGPPRRTTKNKDWEEKPTRKIIFLI